MTSRCQISLCILLQLSFSLSNLENIYYFPSCSGGPISLHHSFTPSLPVRHLESGGALSIKKHCVLVGTFEFNSYERLTWTFLSFIIPLKEATQYGRGSITLYCSREDPVGTCRIESNRIALVELRIIRTTCPVSRLFIR